MSAPFELFAVRLGHADRDARDNFLTGPARAGAMRLDFDMWVARRGDHVIVVDSGFDPEAGRRRGRSLDRHPAEALRALDIDPADVSELVLTHLHYDHAGNVDAFPSARVLVQRTEVAYAAGPAMRHPQLSHFFEAGDVCDVVHGTYGGRVEQLDGQTSVADGVDLHLVGGHTPGLQVARVRTDRGWVVLASDALHYYENLERRNPFPAVVDVAALMDGFDTVLRLADGPGHVIPGHDPAVMERFAAGSDGLPDGIVALHHEPALELAHR